MISKAEAALIGDFSHDRLILGLSYIWALAIFGPYLFGPYL